MFVMKCHFNRFNERLFIQIDFGIACDFKDGIKLRNILYRLDLDVNAHNTLADTVEYVCVCVCVSDQMQ